MTESPGAADEVAGAQRQDLDDAPRLLVEDDGLILPSSVDPESTYDVLLNGQHVWSLTPRLDAGRGKPADTAFIPWPKALRKHLDGRAVVGLRDHVAGDLVATTSHVFGESADHEVRVVDAHGRELVLDKWGRMIRPLANEDASLVTELMTQMEDLLQVMNDRCGVPTFLAYGTLLGAVRDGRLIGYDNDVDLAYVSAHEHPVDIVRENFRIHRTLAESGWVVRRGSGARLNVRLKMPDRSMRFVDIFTAHWTEGTFYVAVDVGAPLARDQVLPPSTVSLLGTDLPAPARPEDLLAATYGPSWRVPDPAFRYQKPRWLGRRLGGWYGGLITHRKHWDAFNASPVERLPLRPSSFARWVHQHYPSSRPLVDLGTGTGRDASFFARTGREVVALDYSTQSVARSAHRARQAGLRATWEPVNFYDARSTLAQGARLSRNEEPPDLYARFTLHALSDPGRQNIWRLASMSLRRGGRFFAEFRTTEDRGLPKAFGDHFRNFLDPDQVVAEIEAAGGRVVHRTSGFGLAPFGPEDPHVCRLVAEWGLPAMEQPGDLTTDLVVRRSGRDPAEAPTLLLLHGLTDSGSAWPDAVTRWGQRYSVLAVDARGHGESPRFTADQLRTGPAAVMVADVLQILEQLPHPPVVVGHSLGGAVALAAAVRDPDLVRCLVLEDPALRPTGHPRRSRRRGEERVESVEASRAAADHGQLLELRRDRHPTWSDNELLQSGIAEQQVDLRYLARGDLLPTRTSQSLFAEVSVPTLVVSGDVSQDVRVTASRESRIAALGNPQVHVVRVTGAGHCVRRDQPDRFYDVVDAFLDAELSAPSTPVTAQSSARSPGGHSRGA